MFLQIRLPCPSVQAGTSLTLTVAVSLSVTLSVVEGCLFFITPHFTLNKRHCFQFTFHSRIPPEASFCSLASSLIAVVVTGLNFTVLYWSIAVE